MRKTYKVRSTFLVFLILICWTDSTFGQSATLRGFVTSAESGEPLVGVNVILQGDDDAFFGASTNSDGFYVISGIPGGAYRFSASYIGFATFRDSFALDPGEIVTRNLKLLLDQAALDEVAVVGRRETAGAARLTAGRQTIQARDLKLIPTPGLSADLANYLSTLPGVVSTGDRGGRLFIRGGGPTQNLDLLDGMMLFKPFHVLGFYSAFPASIINTADVYAGGYGPQFGGKLSSVIDINARNGNKQYFEMAASVDPFVAAARIEGPIVRGGVSVLASVRESLVEQVGSAVAGRALPYRFADRFGKVHARLGNSRVSVTGISTYDRTLTRGAASDTASGTQSAMSWRNDAIGGRLLVLPQTLPVAASVVVSTSRLHSESGPIDAADRTSEVARYEAKADVTHFLGPLNIHWGLMVRTTALGSELVGLYENLSTEKEYLTGAAAYVAPELKLGRGLMVKPGLRIQSFPSKRRFFLEPRLKVIWELGRHRFSGAWGIYHQEIVGLTSRRDIGALFTVWSSSPLGKVPEAMDVLAGWQGSLATWLDVSLEGYYKTLSNLFISEWSALPTPTTRLQSADGRVRGLDFRVEVSKDDFYGLLTYGLAHVTYNAKQSTLAIWYGAEELQFTPPHDRRHQVTLVGRYTLADVDVSVRWQFGSGLPYSQAAGFDGFIFMNRPINFFEEGPTPRIIYERPYNARLPAYHRLDISAERTFEVQEHVSLTLQAGLINAYNRPNLHYLDLFTLERVDQLPFVPTFGLKVAVD